MENTVTISLKHYQGLKDGFDNSPLKETMDNQISRLELEKYKLLETIEKMRDENFVFLYSSGHWLNRSYYIKKDNTPMWIKRMFNN